MQMFALHRVLVFLACSISLSHAVPSAAPLCDISVLRKSERSLHSQQGEDGVIEHLLAGVVDPVPFYVEFGGGETCDNTEALHDAGWQGVLIGLVADDRTVKQRPIHVQRVTPQNVVGIFGQLNVPKHFGVLSVDIDSHDYWVLEAILASGQFRPSVIVVEVNRNCFPLAAVTIPVTAAAPTEYDEYFGATPQAMKHLAELHGYGLVHCEAQGVNCFMLRGAPSCPLQDSFCCRNIHAGVGVRPWLDVISGQMHNFTRISRRDCT